VSHCNHRLGRWTFSREQVTGVKVLVVVFPLSGSLLLLLGWLRLHVALHRFCIRTLDELIAMRARCLLGFERRVDAAISRPVSRTKTRSQSSEHGVFATSEYGYSSSSLFVEGHIRFLRRPDVVEQNGQLPRHCDNCLVPSLLTASRSQMKSPLSKR
jgi:hypothetical protein